MTLVVVGAHAMDAELMAGAIAAAARRTGWPVLVVHLTRGERGHPVKSPDEFGRQLEEELAAAASTLGCDARWAGAPAPLSADEVLPQLSGWLREWRPRLLLTHWLGSWHPSHRAAHQAVRRAISAAGVQTTLGFAENCEDLAGFRPTHLVPVAPVRQDWLSAARCYELFRRSEPGSGLEAPIPYWAYYTASLRVRGLQAATEYAQAVMLEGESPAGLEMVPAPEPATFGPAG